MFQCVKKYFCISNQKIHPFIFTVKYIPIVFSYLHTFLHKTPWKLFDPFITFRLQMWRMDYRYISNFFSLFVTHLWKYYWNAPSEASACSPSNNTIAFFRDIWNNVYVFFDDSKIINGKCTFFLFPPYLSEFENQWFRLCFF